MPTNFPTLLDEFSNPSGADAQSSAPVLHSTQHVNANDAIEALQANVGVDGSTDPDSLDYKIAHFDPAPSSTDAVTEGTSNLYFTYQRVRDTALTALSVATNAAITAADTVLSAFGKLQAQVSNKVDKVAGMGLSTNDYSDTEKTKLAGVADGANNYTHPTQHAPSIITQDASNRFVTDAEKSAWNAKQGALGFAAENSALKGAASGYAPLGSDSKIPSTYLPSYVDDVVEGANLAAFPGTGETSKIYVALDSNKAYRWSGSSYVEISGSPGSTDAVTEGSANLYFTTTRVRAVVLTGLSLVTNAAISATDSVLSALGKLQKQITDLAAANTGDETTETIKTKLGITTLSGSNTGDQTLSGLGGVPAESPSTSGTLTHSGDIILSGSGKRITGDLSNATVFNRLMFQSSTVNGISNLGIAPNGNGAVASFVTFNSSDVDNASTTVIQTTATQSRVIAGKNGTGSYKPLALNVGGADRLTIETAVGAVGIGAAGADGNARLALSENSSVPDAVSLSCSPDNAFVNWRHRLDCTSYSGRFQLRDSGGIVSATIHSAGPSFVRDGFTVNGPSGLGYGAGAGGTVTQTTSRTTTTPAINFPNGDVTLFTAAGSVTPASFSVANTLVAAKDVPTIAVRGATNKYITQVTNVVAGTSFEVTFWTTGGTAVDTPIFHFNLGKGS